MTVNDVLSIVLGHSCVARAYRRAGLAKTERRSNMTDRVTRFSFERGDSCSASLAARSVRCMV